MLYVVIDYQNHGRVCLCLSHSLSQAYTFKDYQQLKSDVVLSGLGPDYKSIETTVSTDHHCCFFALEPKGHQVNLVFQQIMLRNFDISLKRKKGMCDFWEKS